MRRRPGCRKASLERHRIGEAVAVDLQQHGHPLDTVVQSSRPGRSEDTLWRLETALRYRFWKSWTASVSYAFESFEKHDWRKDTLQPFIGISSIYLGSDPKNYTAHIVGFRLGYRFK